MSQPQSSNQVPRGRRRLLVVGSGLVLIIFVSCWFVSARQTEQVYASFSRPDGNYTVVVRRRSVWPSLMPGQASDAPGKVQLYDRNRKLLRETNVEMVQLVESVNWSQKKVTIKLIADWDLPD